MDVEVVVDWDAKIVVGVSARRQGGENIRADRLMACDSTSVTITNCDVQDMD